MTKTKPEDLNKYPTLCTIRVEGLLTFITEGLRAKESKRKAKIKPSEKGKTS